jgi:hypothetical protein
MKKVTTDNLTECTDQEVFDFIANHLLVQNEKSMDKEQDRCLYRSSNGHMCALGCLMTDSYYNGNMESVTVKTLIKGFAFPNLHSELLVVLQNIHDRFLVENWQSQLNKVAENFNLKPYVLSK